MQIEHTIQIEAPVERVWALTIDVERWPDTTPTMTKVERLDDGPLRPGSRARIKQPGQRAKVWTVETVEPGRTFAWGTRAFGCRLIGRHELRATPTGTENRLVLDIEGRAAGLVGRLLRRPMRASIEKENAGFKQAAEATADVAS